MTARFLIVAEKGLPAKTKEGRWPDTGMSKKRKTDDPELIDGDPEAELEADEPEPTDEVPLADGLTPDSVLADETTDDEAPTDTAEVEAEVEAELEAELLDTPEDDSVSQHEWAGDLDESDAGTDPAAAFAAFTGAEGEQAWLDRTQDGTLTGWIRDADGSLYRYSDADAWAVDVDDAGMTRDGADDAPAVPDPSLTDEAAAGVLFDGLEGKTRFRGKLVTPRTGVKSLTGQPLLPNGRTVLGVATPRH